VVGDVGRGIRYAAARVSLPAHPEPPDEKEKTMQVRRHREGPTVERDGREHALPVASVAELLRLPAERLRELLTGDLPAVDGDPGPALPPIDGRTEVWASGVTYLRSRAARMDESTDPDIYDRVYEAERPELFFKSAAWRVVTDGDPIGVREDSAWNVPEPELAIVVNSAGEIVGYGICNDVSSRSIEGENPLYLPQAKVYAGACAISDFFVPAWEVDASALGIRLRVHRGDETIVDDSTSTAEIARDLRDLVSFLYRAENFPDGAWISTGTGIVPADDVTLRAGDRVEIEIDGIGRLRNEVRSGRQHWEDLATR
jgi:2-dehydro-3-deoxy-D-arabinonate dehydratase